MPRKKKVELLDSKERLKLLAENTLEYAIIVLDPTGKVDDWNKGARHLIGYTEKEIIGQHFEIFFTPEDRKAHRPENELQIAKTKGLANDENWLVRKDGVWFWASGATSPIFDKVGNLVGYAKIIRDLTDRKEMEQQKDDFISVVSHELRTPLTVAKIVRSSLKKYLEQANDEKGLHYFERISQSIDQLENILAELLRVTEIEKKDIEYKRESFCLSELAKEVAHSMQAAHAHKIIVKGSNDQKILGYKPQIVEVMMNLLTNAIKYSPDQKEVHVIIKDAGTHITVGVRDFGIGIAEEDQKKVFDRFYRTMTSREKRLPGVGLGLYLSKKIVERHNGRIWVESVLGKGSTFLFSIPKP